MDFSAKYYLYLQQNQINTLMERFVEDMLRELPDCPKQFAVQWIVEFRHNLVKLQELHQKLFDQLDTNCDSLLTLPDIIVGLKNGNLKRDEYESFAKQLFFSGGSPSQSLTKDDWNRSLIEHAHKHGFQHTFKLLKIAFAMEIPPEFDGVADSDGVQWLLIEDDHHEHHHDGCDLGLISTREVLIKGSMVKQGKGEGLGGRKSWKTRWFELSGEGLRYYDGPGKGKTMGEIQMGGISHVCHRLVGRPNSFVIKCLPGNGSKHESLVISAKSNDEARAWVTTYKSARRIFESIGGEDLMADHSRSINLTSPSVDDLFHVIGTTSSSFHREISSAGPTPYFSTHINSNRNYSWSSTAHISSDLLPAKPSSLFLQNLAGEIVCDHACKNLPPLAVLGVGGAFPTSLKDAQERGVGKDGRGERGLVIKDLSVSACLDMCHVSGFFFASEGEFNGRRVSQSVRVSPSPRSPLLLPLHPADLGPSTLYFVLQIFIENGNFSGENSCRPTAWAAIGPLPTANGGNIGGSDEFAAASAVIYEGVLGEASLPQLIHALGRGGGGGKWKEVAESAVLFSRGVISMHDERVTSPNSNFTVVDPFCPAATSGPPCVLGCGLSYEVKNHIFIFIERLSLDIPPHFSEDVVISVELSSKHYSNCFEVFSHGPDEVELREKYLCVPKQQVAAGKLQVFNFCDQITLRIPLTAEIDGEAAVIFRISDLKSGATHALARLPLFIQFGPDHILIPSKRFEIPLEIDGVTSTPAQKTAIKMKIISNSNVIPTDPWVVESLRRDEAEEIRKPISISTGGGPTATPSPLPPSSSISPPGVLKKSQSSSAVTIPKETMANMCECENCKGPRREVAECVDSNSTQFLQFLPQLLQKALDSISFCFCDARKSSESEREFSLPLRRVQKFSYLLAILEKAESLLPNWENESSSIAHFLLRGDDHVPLAILDHLAHALRGGVCEWINLNSNKYFPFLLAAALGVARSADPATYTGKRIVKYRDCASGLMRSAAGALTHIAADTDWKTRAFAYHRVRAVGHFVGGLSDILGSTHAAHVAGIFVKTLQRIK